MAVTPRMRKSLFISSKTSLSLPPSLTVKLMVREVKRVTTVTRVKRVKMVKIG